MKVKRFLDAAVEEARKGLDEGGKGCGAVLVKGDEVVSRSRDRTRQLNDPIAVAEVDCVRRAGRRNDQSSLTLYTTRYPDMLCAGTLVQFSVGRLVVGLEPTDSAAISLLTDKEVPVDFVSHAGCARLREELSL